MTEHIYTTNRLILGYAEVRYWLGCRAESFVARNRWIYKHPLTRWFTRWVADSEGRYNCLIEPWLGTAIRYEKRYYRALNKAVAAQRAGNYRKADRWFKVGNRWEDLKDANHKLRYPDWVGRLDHLARFEAAIAARSAEK